MRIYNVILIGAFPVSNILYLEIIYLYILWWERSLPCVKGGRDSVYSVDIF
jgi:hypothetical protein